MTSTLRASAGRTDHALPLSPERSAGDQVGAACAEPASPAGFDKTHLNFGRTLSECSDTLGRFWDRIGAAALIPTPALNFRG
jgi:hypothetical protein